MLTGTGLLHDATVGDRVRLAGCSPRRWWDVRAVGRRYVVCTQQAPFVKRGVLQYTVLDQVSGVRGPCNQIGQGWGDGTFSDSECADLLAGLELGGWEVSWRNRVVLDVLERKVGAP